MTSDHIYGEFNNLEPVLVEIMQSSAMQRLKHINQYGAYILSNPELSTTRFEHSVGVMLLLRKLGASLKEQIAGLIHDIPHTAFSHVIDYVFDRKTQHDVHERFHAQVLKGSDIPSILTKFGFNPKDFEDETIYTILERDIPDLCADRMDYFLRDALITNIISKEQCAQILDGFAAKDGELLIDDMATAKLAAEKYLEVAEKFWASDLQAYLYQVLGDALKLALEKNIITMEDLFKNDEFVLQKLDAAQDKEINSLIHQIRNKSFTQGTKEDHDFSSASKVRYIDPKIGVVRLSEIDTEFADLLEEKKLKLAQVRYFKRT